MKKLLALVLTLCMLIVPSAFAADAETVILLSDEQITVDGSAITEDTSAAVFLARINETHEDVPEALKDVENRVVTITDGGVYRISGKASDLQIAVKAASDDEVRLILDNVDITCRTASAVAIYSAHDPRTAGAYGVTIELADGSDNRITGSHNAAEDPDPEFDGAIGSQVSLGFEGSGSLTVDADNEGVEVASGHMTINGGVFHIASCDDPLNVSEDGVGVLTVNDGYLYSAVKNLEGGEGDGIDSNGWIVFNGGTAINLAHPASQDGGIDSDMGSSVNGGVIVGAGNMYDPIESTSQQLFMMLEFGQATNDLVVVTDAQNHPIFAYDFPHDYMYIAFSTPDLKDGETYHVYLGGEIEGEQQDGLYTSITAYTPGTRMQHGEGNAAQRMTMQAPDMGDMGNVPEMPQGGFGGKAPDMPQDDGRFDMNAIMTALNQLDLNELLKDADLNELLKDKDLNSLLTGFAITDLLTDEQMKAIFGDMDVSMLESMNQMGGRGFGGGFGGPRGMESSSDVATTDFVLTHENTGFTNVVAAE